MRNPIEEARLRDRNQELWALNETEKLHREKEFRQTSNEFIKKAGKIFEAAYIRQGIIELLRKTTMRPNNWAMYNVLLSDDLRCADGGDIYDPFAFRTNPFLAVRDRPITGVTYTVHWSAEGGKPIGGGESGCLYPWRRARYEVQYTVNEEMIFISALNGGEVHLKRDEWSGRDDVVGTLLEQSSNNPLIETVYFKWFEGSPGHFSPSPQFSSPGSPSALIPLFDKDFTAFYVGIMEL